MNDFSQTRGRYKVALPFIALALVGLARGNTGGASRNEHREGCQDIECITGVIERSATMTSLSEPNLGVSLSEHVLVFAERKLIVTNSKLSEHSQIYTLAIGATGSPKLLAAGTTPSLSPDGRYVAFWSNDENARQLWVADLRTRTARQVTRVPDGLPAPNAAEDIQSFAGANRIAWSPSGDRVVVSVAVNESQPASNREPAFASEPWLGSSGSATKPPQAFSSAEHQRDPWKMLFRPAWPQVAFWDISGEHDQLDEIDIRSGDVKPLVVSPLSYFEPAWSADGRYIAALERHLYTVPAQKMDDRLVLIDARSGQVAPQAISGWLKFPSFSADGAKLSVVQQAPNVLGFPYLEVLDLKNGRVSQVASSGVVQWDGARWDGGRLIYSQRDGLQDEIVSASPTTPSSKNLKGMISDFAIAGHRVFAIVRNPDSPAIMGEIKGDTIDPYYIRPSNLQADELATYHPLHWHSDDGSVVDGMLLLPKVHHGLPPVILDPYPALALYGFYAGMQMDGNSLFLKNGYALFFLNARTPHSVMSFTRDEHFGNSAIGNPGLKLLVADIASGLKYLRETGLVDGQRIMGYGHSNAAMSLMDLLPRYNGLKCAVVHNPALFGQESYFATPEPARHAEWYGGPHFWDAPSFYDAFDPLAQIKSFNTPLFLIGGSEDWAVEQSLFFNGMRSAGKNITFAVYVGDGHVPSEGNLPDYWWRVLTYFKQC